MRQRCASTARADPACGRGGGEEQRDEKEVHREARRCAGGCGEATATALQGELARASGILCLHSCTSRCTSSSPLAMARAAEFRAIEEALMGALKFFDTRPSAQDTQRFVALCGEAAATAAAALAAAQASRTTAVSKFPGRRRRFRGRDRQGGGRLGALSGGDGDHRRGPDEPEVSGAPAAET